MPLLARAALTALGARYVAEPLALNIEPEFLKVGVMRQHAERRHVDSQGRYSKN